MPVWAIPSRPTRATQIDPTFAYAHYYAGLAYSKVRRADRMAAHFEVFLKLVPKAPNARLSTPSCARFVDAKAVFVLRKATPRIHRKIGKRASLVEHHDRLATPRHAERHECRTGLSR